MHFLGKNLKMHNTMSKLCMIFLCLPLITQEAHAYFDPGTGSMLIQLLIALIAGATLFYRRILLEIRKLPTRLPNLKKFRGYLTPYSKQYVLAVVIGIYAVIFYSSKNVSNLTIFSFILSVFLFVLTSLLFTYLLALFFTKHKNKEKIISGMLFLMFIYFMRLPISEAVQIFFADIFGSNFIFFVEQYAVNFSSWLVVSGLFFGIGWRLSKRTLKVSIVIAAMSLLPLFNLAKGVYYVVLDKQTTPLQARNMSTTFSNQPNIYFLVFDSYASIDALEAMDISSSETTAYLHENDFTIYPSFYTNMQSTRRAMSSYFGMDIEFGSKAYGMSEDKMQKIISGDNPVFKLLNGNGYTTKIIMVNEWFKFNMNSFMIGNYCFANSCHPSKIDGYYINYFSIFDNIILSGYLHTMYKHLQSFSFTQGTEFLSEVAENKEGNFVYAHVGAPGHAKTSRVSYKGSCNEKEEKYKYKERLVQTNSILTTSVDIIMKKDPSAVIIIASDHGAYIFNRCAAFAPLLSREEVVERQGALLAIRWPKDYDGKYDENIKSSANLFRYIFSYLAGHERLLENKPDDDAFYLHNGVVYQSIDNGVILPPPASELNRVTDG